MAQKILQIRFHADAPKAEYDALCVSVAPNFNAVPGLCWKIWTYNESLQSGSGIYLFEDQESLDAYLSGHIVAKVKSGEFGLRNVEIWTGDVHSEPSRITNAPVSVAKVAA